MNAAGPAPRKRLKVAYGDSKVAFSVPVDASVRDACRAAEAALAEFDAVPAGCCCKALALPDEIRLRSSERIADVVQDELLVPIFEASRTAEMGGGQRGTASDNSRSLGSEREVGCPRPGGLVRNRSTMPAENFDSKNVVNLMTLLQDSEERTRLNNELVQHVSTHNCHALAMAGKLPLAIKLLAIGIQPHELIIDATSSYGFVTAALSDVDAVFFPDHGSPAQTAAAAHNSTQHHILEVIKGVRLEEGNSDDEGSASKSDSDSEDEAEDWKPRSCLNMARSTAGDEVHGDGEQQQQEQKQRAVVGSAGKEADEVLAKGDKCWARWIERADVGNIHFYKARVAAVHWSDGVAADGGGGGGVEGGARRLEVGYTVEWDEPDGYEPSLRLAADHVRKTRHKRQRSRATGVSGFVRESASETKRQRQRERERERERQRDTERPGMRGAAAPESRPPRPHPCAAAGGGTAPKMLSERQQLRLLGVSLDEDGEAGTLERRCTSAQEHPEKIARPSASGCDVGGGSDKQIHYLSDDSAPGEGDELPILEFSSEAERNEYLLAQVCANEEGDNLESNGGSRAPEGHSDGVDAPGSRSATPLLPGIADAPSAAPGSQSSQSDARPRGQVESFQADGGDSQPVSGQTMLQSQQTKGRACGICNKVGHNRRTCRSNGADASATHGEGEGSCTAVLGGDAVGAPRHATSGKSRANVRDAHVGIGIDIKGARNTNQNFKMSRLKQSKSFEHMLFVCRTRDPADWTNVAELDADFVLGHVSRANFNLAVSRLASMGPDKRRACQRATGLVASLTINSQRHSWLGAYVDWVPFNQLNREWWDAHLSERWDAS